MGKLIIIEGGDGSGKTVQAKLLTEYFQTEGIGYRLFDFPNYGSFYGSLVKRLLDGEFGRLNQLSPYLASLPYSLDRSAFVDELRSYLTTSGIAVSNRYTTSSMAHWGARLDKDKDFWRYVDWLSELEYGHIGLPKEDLVIYLYVPWRIGYKLSEHKYADRKSHSGLDIQERDQQNRARVEERYLKLCERFDHWHKIDCTDQEGLLLTKETVGDRIIALLKSEKITP